jgi:hypothetical protein
MTQPATLEEIDERLRSLPETLVVDPKDVRAMARIVELRVPTKRAADRKAPSRRGLIRLGAAGAAIAVVVIVNVVAAYYAPTYSRALADAPGIGGPSSKILAGFGLNSRGVTAINDSATSSGHTLRLAAGYADGLRTVLFVSVDGKGLNDNPKGYLGDYGLGNFTLTDQFGHTYVPSGVGTPNWIQFTPLAWPASSVGARLTLHVTSIDAMWLITGRELQGDWSLHATLVAEPAHSLALPAPVRTPNANYTFTSIRSSTTTLIIHWTVTGPVLDEEMKLRPTNVPGGTQQPQYQVLMQAYFWPTISDASGQPVLLEEWGTTFTNPATSELTAFIPGPGRYRIQLGGALTADQQRWIVVP